MVCGIRRTHKRYNIDMVTCSQLSAVLMGITQALTEEHSGRFLFHWFSVSLCFLFHLPLCANARRGRTQPGRFVTCVGSGHGARPLHAAFDTSRC